MTTAHSRADVEAGADVVDDGRRGGGGERQDALGADVARGLGQLQVVGAEVVAPLGDAVRLVDREERDRRALEQVARKRSLLNRSGAT